MAGDMFLELSDIEGDSKDETYAGKIEVSSWGWGMTQSGTTHAGTGGGAGKVAVQDMIITKNVDKASPNLVKFCCSGKHFDTARLIVRKAGDKPLEYLIIEMEEIVISSVSVGGSEGDVIPMETVGLNFAKFKYIYTPQTDKGSGDAAIDVGYDIPANVVT